jgi:uncharacterized protein YggE
MSASGLAFREMRRSITAAVGLLGLALSVAGAHAQTAEPSPRVIVIGEASVRAAPDHAAIRGGITTTAQSVKQASDANTKVMTAITAALLEAGIAQKDIQTSQFSVEPVYTTASSASPSKLSAFRVSNQVSVTIRQIAQVGEIIDRLVKAGATDIGNIEFLVSDSAKVLDQAREAAIADARHKAELYAHAAGVNLGRIAWITESSDFLPQPIRAFGERAKMASQQVPIQAGEETLRVSVTVAFDIER